jgi:hypothetical protein
MKKHDIPCTGGSMINAAAIVGIQRGLQGMYEGTGEDAEDAFASLERELGIPERE